MLIDCQEILRYLRSIKEFWSCLLQHNKTAMERVDGTTVKALELTAPWASTVDAQILRGKVLGGEVFRAFNQRDREEIWIRLHSFKGLVPSLYGFFEDVKLLEALADCLKWVIRPGPRETVSTALKKIYTGVNQDTGTALVQETETTFMPVQANLVYRMDLGCRQLQAFAMRYHREIPKKPSGKNLLARPMAIVDTTKLREMADLANRLGFESSDITALKQYPSSADLNAVTEKSRPILVTAGPGEPREQRCGMPHIQNYRNDRNCLFITHLHDDRDEQSEGITSFFRLRSVYINFYGMPSQALSLRDHSSPQQHLIPATGEAVYEVSHIVPSDHPPTQEPEHRDFNVREDERKQIEDTVMQEWGKEEQRPLLQVQGILTQDAIIQEPQLQESVSDSSTLEQQTQEQNENQLNLLRDASALREQEQKQEQQRRKLLYDASMLRSQEQEHEQYRQKLTKDATAFKEQEQQEHNETQLNLQRDASALREQEQKQEQQRRKLLYDASMLRSQEQEHEQYRQKLTKDATAFKEQEQQQERRRQKLLSESSALGMREQECQKKLEWYAGTPREEGQEQEQQSQKLLCDISTLEKQEQAQERRRQKLISNAITLEEQEQRQMYQKLTMEANTLREQEQGRGNQRQSLATDETRLVIWKQTQEEQLAGEIVSQDQRQEDQRLKYASDLKNQGTRHNQQLQKFIADRNATNKPDKRQRKERRDKLKQKRGQKSVAQIGLGSKQDESEIAQEREEQDIGNLQRQGQDEQADLESSPPLELEHRGVYVNRNPHEVQVETYSVAVEKGGTQMAVPAPRDDDGPQQDGTQEQVQEGRQNKEAQEDNLCEAETQENEGNEIRAQRRGKEHGVQETGEERQTGEDGGGAHNDIIQDHRQAYETQEAGQEVKEHEDTQIGGENQYRARKRRVVTEDDDGAALRAQQKREGRNPVERNKYQRLNRFGPLNHDMNC